MFSPETFLNATFEDANSTSLDPVPEAEYKAISEPVSKESFASFDIKNGERAGQKMHQVTVQWKIDDPSAGEYNGRRVRQRIIIDLNEAGDALDFGKGKNIGLGRLREALGQNIPGKPWAFSFLGSQVAKIKVKQTLDKVDSSKIYSEVDMVAPLN